MARERVFRTPTSLFSRDGQHPILDTSLAAPFIETIPSTLLELSDVERAFRRFSWELRAGGAPEIARHISFGYNRDHHLEISFLHNPHMEATAAIATQPLEVKSFYDTFGLNKNLHREYGESRKDFKLREAIASRLKGLHRYTLRLVELTVEWVMQCDEPALGGLIHRPYLTFAPAYPVGLTDFNKALNGKMLEYQLLKAP